MIQFAKLPVTSDGRSWSTLADAQFEELKILLEFPDGKPVDSAAAVLLKVVTSAHAVVDVLTMKTSSKPSARAIHGGRKPRKAKETPAAPTDGKQ